MDYDGAMLDSLQFERVAQALPVLPLADPVSAREFREAASLVHIPAGRDVFVEGARVEALALLLNGQVRVYKIGASGREITLYRFGLGESCILSANAILSQASFPALATVEQDAEALLIPASLFRSWVRESDAWREFVFSLLARRLTSLMMLIEEVAFQRMDRRVAALLLERAALHNPVTMTHQEIAAELGSSREVVSRILEDFDHAGLVHTRRGTIEILDAKGLRTRTAA